MTQFYFHAIQQVDYHNHRDAIFCEVKWKRLIKDEAEHIVSGLKEKAGKVKGKWNEHYCLIAKKNERKGKLDFFAFDFEDIGVEVGKP